MTAASDAHHNAGHLMGFTDAAPPAKTDRRPSPGLRAMVLAQTRATLLLAGRGARDRWCGPTTSEAGRRDPLEGALE